MNQTEKLRIEADRRAEILSMDLLAMTERLRPASLADEVVGLLEQKFSILRRIEQTIKRNPFVAVAVVTGLWWLALQAARPAPAEAPVTGRRQRHIRLTRKPSKGDHHGLNNTDIGNQESPQAGEQINPAE